MTFFHPSVPPPVEPPVRIRAKRWEPRITLLEASGEIDTIAAGALDEHLREHWDPRRYLLLDLSEVTFLCSAGLAVLLAAREKSLLDRVDLRLIATERPVQRLIVLTGLAESLPTYPTLLAALPLQH